MQFENSFYTIQSASNEENEATFTIKLNAEHPIFAGHFPEKPITPGVVQMEIVKELSKKALDKELTMISMGNCKFLNFLDPNEAPIIDVVLKFNPQEDNSVKVSAQMKDESGLYLKMSSQYK